MQQDPALPHGKSATSSAFHIQWPWESCTILKVMGQLNHDR